MISIIIPTYNREKTIKRAIDSVLMQTYKDIELIIVDDGSTDNTKKIVYDINDKRIIYIKQNNGGAASARNTGIINANGEYIAFQDSDDFWYKSKLQEQLDALIKNKADITFCKLKRNNYSKCKQTIWPLISEGFVDREKFTYAGIVSTQTLLGKAEVFKNNLFDVELPALEDYAFSIVASSKYKIYHQSKVLVELYLQDDSLTADIRKYLDSYKIILNKYEKYFDEFPSAKAKIYEIIAGEERILGINNVEMLRKAYKLNKNKKTLFKILLAKIGIYSKLKG